MNKKEIGLHLQLKESYTNLAQLALELGLQTFQFFLLEEKSKQHLLPTAKDLKSFLKIRRESFSTLYAHSSYKVNLATGRKKSSIIAEYLLKKELKIARRLELNHIIVHPGNASGFEEQTTNTDEIKILGAKALANILNTVLEKEEKITILLENTAHGGNTIGSNLEDFVIIKSFLKYPHKVGYCLDIAHAFVYGHDMENQESFFELLEKTIEIDKIKLIHLNDSLKPKGSKIDTHMPPGEGLIGKEILHKIINHPRLKDKPYIIEVPPKDIIHGKKILDTLRDWR